MVFDEDLEDGSTAPSIPSPFNPNFRPHPPAYNPYFVRSRRHDHTADDDQGHRHSNGTNTNNISNNDGNSGSDGNGDGDDRNDDHSTLTSSSHGSHPFLSNEQYWEDREQPCKVAVFLFQLRRATSSVVRKVSDSTGRRIRQFDEKHNLGQSTKRLLTESLCRSRDLTFRVANGMDRGFHSVERRCSKFRNRQQQRISIQI